MRDYIKAIIDVHNQTKEIKSNRAWREECESLRQWKREASEVLNKWDEVFVAAGKPGMLGHNMADCVKAEIERLNRRVAELEGYEQECANLDAELKDYQNCLAELAALKADDSLTVAYMSGFHDGKKAAALKAGQGEPFGWYWTLRNKDDAIIEDGIVVNEWFDRKDVQPDWIPVYLAAPTIPEGYILAKRYYCTKCGGSFTTKVHEGCDYMAIDLAAPKPDHVNIQSGISSADKQLMRNGGWLKLEEKP